MLHSLEIAVYVSQCFLFQFLRELQGIPSSSCGGDKDKGLSSSSLLVRQLPLCFCSFKPQSPFQDSKVRPYTLTPVATPCPVFSLFCQLGASTVRLEAPQAAGGHDLGLGGSDLDGSGRRRPEPELVLGSATATLKCGISLIAGSAALDPLREAAAAARFVLHILGSYEEGEYTKPQH